MWDWLTKVRVVCAFNLLVGIAGLAYWFVTRNWVWPTPFNLLIGVWVLPSAVVSRPSPTGRRP